MLSSQLDFYFPFFIFFYGILLLFMMALPAYAQIRSRLKNGLHDRFRVKMPLSNFSEISLWVMVILSGLWSLQNLLFGS